MIALFFDTETTGVKSWRDPGFIPGLVQLGAILQDTESKRVLAELNLICKQPDSKLIPVGASNVHGISDELAERFGLDLELIDFAFSELAARADVVVAHNIAYDQEVVKDNMPLSQEAIGGKQLFCTMQASLYEVKAPLTDKQIYYFKSRSIKPDAPFKVPNLTETHMHFYGKPFEGAHDAMADIRACRDVYFTLQERGLYQEVGGQVVPTNKLDDLRAAA